MGLRERDPHDTCGTRALSAGLSRAIGGGCSFARVFALPHLFFHMPLFVFVSGMFSKSLAKRRERAFDELIIPFIACQLLWLVVLAVVDGPRVAASRLLVPQFALWYLVALFAWRVLLPDLAKVRFMLPIAAVLFFIGQFFGGIDNAFAVQRTLGFLFFFLLGYRLDAGRVVSFVRRVPLAVAVVFLLGAFVALFTMFCNGSVSYEAVFYVLCHGTHIGGSVGYLFGIGMYSAAFFGAVVLSLCFLRVVLPLKSLKAMSKIGSDTMPLYLAHGYVVVAMVKGLCLLTPLTLLPELVLLIFFALLTAGIVVAFSTEKWRDMYDKAIRACEAVLLKRA